MLNSLRSGNRLRVDFSKNPKHIDIPNLLQLQQKSYEQFLNVGKKIEIQVLKKYLTPFFPSTIRKTD